MGFAYLGGIDNSKEIIEWKKDGREQVEKLYFDYQLQIGSGQIEEIKFKRLRK